MTTKNFPSDLAVSRVEELASFLAEINEADPVTISAIGDLLQNIILEKTVPESVSREAGAAVASMEKLNNSEYDFDAFYDDVCEKTNRMQNLLEEDCNGEGEEIPPMSSYDIEDLEMQFDVMDGLFGELSGGDRHLLDVFSNLTGKILDIENIPAKMREHAEDARDLLRRMESGELEMKQGGGMFVETINSLRAEFARAVAAARGENSAGDAGENGIALISEAETGIALLESMESEILALENGDSGATSRIARIIKDIKHTAENELSPLAHTFLNGVAARLEKGNIPNVSDAVDPLLATKDLLFDFFDARMKGEEGLINESVVRNTLAKLNSASGATRGSAAPMRQNPRPRVAVEIPKVVIAPGNPDMLEFVTETREYIQGAESAIMILENEPGNDEQLNEVFRCFHNIKGISGFMALTDAQMLAHEAESMMEKARKGEVEFAGIYATLAFEALDTFKKMVDGVEAAHGGAKYEVPETFAEILTKLRDPEYAASAQVVPSPAVTPGGTPAAAKPAGNGTAKTSNRTLHDSMVKLSTDRLDNLVDMVGELVIANAMVAQEHRKKYKVKKDREMAQRMAHMEKITRELQEMAMSLRMVSIQGAFLKLARIARDVSHKSGILVDFTSSGNETELDRNVVEELTSPLVHMVRNSIDHGIEAPAQRLAAGKPEKGSLHISAFHEGGNVVIRISDDGKGLDREAILAKAISRGLVTGEQELSDREVFEMIFQPGFSTAAAVTDISGRGVGMDVVKRTIENMRGRIEIQSKAGEGTTFTIRLPLTLAIIDGMVVDVGGEKYIIPTIAIQESIRPVRGQITTVTGQGEMLKLRDNLMPMFRLHELFEIRNAKTNPLEALAIVVGENGTRCALMVDNLVGQQQVVIKSIGKLFDNVEGVSGGAIMGDGNVALILDAPGLVRLANSPN